MKKFLIGIFFVSFRSFGMCDASYFSTLDLAKVAVARFNVVFSIDSKYCKKVTFPVSVDQTLKMAMRCLDFKREPFSIAIVMTPKNAPNPCSTGKDQYYVIVNNSFLTEGADETQGGVY